MQRSNSFRKGIKKYKNKIRKPTRFWRRKEYPFWNNQDMKGQKAHIEELIAKGELKQLPTIEKIYYGHVDNTKR